MCHLFEEVYGLDRGVSTFLDECTPCDWTRSSIPSVAGCGAGGEGVGHVAEQGAAAATVCELPPPAASS